MSRGTILTIGLLFWSLSIHSGEANNNIVETPQVDPFEGAQEVLHYSFEQSKERPYDGDLDLDNMPDEWTRRKGPTFPQYVGCSIDRTQGYESSQSLKIDLNGGNFAIYSPIHKKGIDPDYSYVFEGRIRTENLKNSAAIMAVSFLNAKRQRVQHYVSEPITGTWNDWYHVSIKMLPREDVKYAVLACHLVNQRTKDIRGTVWFDGLRLGRKPRLDTSNQFADQFKQISDQDIQLNFKIRGLDDSQDNKLYLKLTDSQDKLIDEEELNVGEENNVTWTPSPEKNIGIGYYQVYAELRTKNRESNSTDQSVQVIADTYKSFVVMDLLDQHHKDYQMNGEFGWSVSDDELLGENVLRDMSEITGQAGINWLKYPVWKNSYKTDQKQVVQLFKKIYAHGITPVGVLRTPPQNLREQFKSDWRGVSEVFNMPRRFWAQSLESTIAHLSAHVQYWQMGGDDDLSFVGGKTLDQTIHTVKSHFDIVGRNTKIGVPWRWKSALPDKINPSDTFMAIKGGIPNAQEDELFYTGSQPVEEINLLPEELYQKIHNIKNQSAPKQSVNPANIPLWVLLKPLKKTPEHNNRERADNLVKRMVAAKRGGADQICAMNVFSEEYGLMQPDGSPTLMFLPWRTTALALRNTTYMDSLKLNNGSTNHLFKRDGEVVMLIWNEEEVNEELFLGDSRRVEIYNVWGQELEPEIIDTRHQLQVNSSPLIIRYCSAEMVKFQLGVNYYKGKAAGALGTVNDGIRIKNPFDKGIAVDLEIDLPDQSWNIEPRQMSVQLGGGDEKIIKFRLSLPPDVSVGHHSTTINCTVYAPDSDSGEPYQLKIEKPYQIGMGEIGLKVTNRINKHGQLEITQSIINNTSPRETLSFECKLYAPGIKRIKRQVIKLGADPANARNVQKMTYVLPNPESWFGKRLRLKAEQVNGRRVLNYKWIVSPEGQEWQEASKLPKNSSRPDSRQ